MQRQRHWPHTFRRVLFEIRHLGEGFWEEWRWIFFAGYRRIVILHCNRLFRIMDYIHLKLLMSNHFQSTGVFINDRAYGATAVLGVDPEKVVILCRMKTPMTTKLKKIG